MENKCDGCNYYREKEIIEAPCVFCSRSKIDYYKKEKKKITLYRYTKLNRCTNYASQTDWSTTPYCDKYSSDIVKIETKEIEIEV